MRATKPMPAKRFSNFGWITSMPRAGHRGHRNFCRASGLPILATCRRHQNHGKFNGSVEEQIRISARHGIRCLPVDLEIESAENAVDALGTFRGQGARHSFLSQLRRNAVARSGPAPHAEDPADGYKIVTTARKPSDNYRVLALTKSHPRTPLIVLAMGETGFPTRVLSRPGRPLHYAAPNASEGTAKRPGERPDAARACTDREISHSAKITA